MMPPRALRLYGCQPSNFAGAGVAHGDDDYDSNLAAALGT